MDDKNYFDEGRYPTGAESASGERAPSRRSGFYSAYLNTGIREADEKAVVSENTDDLYPVNDGYTERNEYTEAVQSGHTFNRRGRVSSYESGRNAGYSFLLPKILVESPFVLLVAVALLALTVIFVPSGRMTKAQVSDQKDFFGDVSGVIGQLKRQSVSSIFELDAVYILPWGEQKNPAPHGLTEKYQENDIDYIKYTDETIEVVYWSEYLMRSECHFAKVTVADPTQLRSAYAGGEFGSSERDTPEKIAGSVNAVVAINADFCGYRNTGVIIRQNTLYRNKPNGWDVLLIDSLGNFHIMNDRDVESSGILEQYEIVNTFEFGPSLVIDGQINFANTSSGCGEYYNFHNSSPRTAVGQIDELTYLLCVVEGKSKTSWGVLVNQLAEIMYNKGCVQAYNLDGGKSSTLVLLNESMNTPLWGGQRVMSDILYFASALPEDVQSAYTNTDMTAIGDDIGAQNEQAGE